MGKELDKYLSNEITDFSEKSSKLRLFSMPHIAGHLCTLTSLITTIFITNPAELDFSVQKCAGQAMQTGISAFLS